MKMYVKRIKNIPFTIIHYLGIIVLIIFPIRAYTLWQHVELYHGDHHLMDTDTVCREVISYMVFALIFYLTKTVIGYLGALGCVWLSNNYLNHELRFFDFGCDSCMSAEYSDNGLRYLNEALDAGTYAMYVAVSMFFLAFALVTIKLIVNKVKNRGMEPVDKKKNEIVNPELEREGSDSVSSGYLD